VVLYGCETWSSILREECRPRVFAEENIWNKEKEPDVGGWIILKIDVREIGWGCTDWIGLVQDMHKWKALVNTVMILWFP
jgi:hypothetical protein